MNSIPILVTHGAGASIESLILREFRSQLLCYQFDVHAFNFDYMEKIRLQNKKRPPEKMDKLKSQFAQQILNNRQVTCIAGKSMGGRVATMLAADKAYQSLGIQYVFVKKNVPRIEHFNDIQAQVHIFQGTRDSFGRPEQVNAINLPSNIHVHWVEGANHDFQILKRLNVETSEAIRDICKKMREVIQVGSILNE